MHRRDGLVGTGVGVQVIDEVASSEVPRDAALLVVPLPNPLLCIVRVVQEGPAPSAQSSGAAVLLGRTLGQRALPQGVGLCVGGRPHDDIRNAYVAAVLVPVDSVPVHAEVGKV